MIYKVSALAAVLLVAAASAVPATTDSVRLATEEDLKRPAVSDDMVNHINSLKTTWTAKKNPKFVGKTLGDAARLCGTKIGKSDIAKAKKRLPLRKVAVPDAIPASFDARTQWSQCPIIAHIRDQSDCGSCWAFGSTEAFNDRVCISTNGTYQKELSAQDTASCCNLFNGCFSSSGCDGGMPQDAWGYFVKTGLVTGGDYNTVGTGTTCFPYQLPNCAHHEPGPYANCSTNEYPTPACPNPSQCSESKYPIAWNDDKQFAKSAYNLEGVAQIQTDIMTNGPVTASFTVFEDFLTYESGVYTHQSGPALGGHSIRILGWGVMNNTPYWIVANSWNQYWGNQGFFYIKRGVNECGIEDAVCAGHA